MRGNHRFWISLVVLFLLAAVLGTQSVIASDSTTIAVDAVPGGGVDANRTVTGTDPFNVDVVITEAGTPYQGYQYRLQWDAAVLAFDDAIPLMPADLSLCSENTVLGSTVSAGCVREQGSITFTGPVATVTLHCVGDGYSPVHLMNLAEDQQYGSATLQTGGASIETSVADAMITCGEGSGPPPATPSPAGTPAGPLATRTPVPPGMEVLPLFNGCQFQTWTGNDGTTPGEVAGLVGPAGSLTSLWAQQPPPTWKGYSPEFPQVSDMEPLDLLDVVAICMAGPGEFVRPEI